MRAQKFTLAIFVCIKEERIMHFARGMPFWEIQRREIVPVVFDVRSFSNGKAHIAKDGCNFLKHLHNRVQGTDMFRLWRQGHVELFSCQLRFQCFVFKCR